MKWSRKIKLGLTVTNGVVEPTGGNTTGPTVIPEPKILVSDIKITDLPASELSKLTVNNLPQVEQNRIADLQGKARSNDQFETLFSHMVGRPTELEVQFNQSGIAIERGFENIANLQERTHPQLGWKLISSCIMYWNVNGLRRVTYRLYLSQDNKSWMHWYDGDVYNLFVRRNPAWSRVGTTSIWSVRS